MAALQHRIGPSAVHGGGNIRSLGRSGAAARPDAVNDDDSQAGTVVGRLEAILASFDGCDRALGVSEISHRIGLP